MPLVGVGPGPGDRGRHHGRLTAAQRTSILADLESRMDDVVNGEFSFGFRGGHGGPSPGMDPGAAAPTSGDA